MATPASIAARRERALQRIARSLRVTLEPVRGVADLRHAAELEQIANHLDPEGRAPAVSPEDGMMREAPFTRHEDTLPRQETPPAASEGDGGSSPAPEENTAAVAVAPEDPAKPPPDAQPQRNPDHAREQRPRRIHGRR